MNSAAVTVIGVAAAFLTTSSFVPQVIQTWKTKSAEDFSWAYLAMFSSGITLWLVYGLMRKDPAIIGANGITLVLILSISYVKWRERRR